MMREVKMYCFGKKVLFCLFCFLVVMGLPYRSSATMVEMSLEDLGNNSEAAIVGRVESAESLWSNDGETIITSALVSVARVLKGSDPGKLVTVEYDGGEVNGLGLLVSDMPKVSKGEDVVLFLKAKYSGAAGSEGAGIGKYTYEIVGKVQGKYTIGPNGTATKNGVDIPIAELESKIRKGE